MRIAPVIARLQVETAIFKSISFARSLNTIDIATPFSSLPVAFVHPLKDTAAPSTTMQIISQDMRGIVAVMIGAEHASVGEDPLEDAREAVFTALLGYQINGRPLEFIEGEVIEATPDYILWRDLFTYPRLLRNPLS